MIVEELIEKLQTMNPNAEVRIDADIIDMESNRSNRDNLKITSIDDWNEECTINVEQYGYKEAKKYGI
jgi:hypothetical protein